MASGNSRCLRPSNRPPLPIMSSLRAPDSGPLTVRSDISQGIARRPRWKFVCRPKRKICAPGGVARFQRQSRSPLLSKATRSGLLRQHERRQSCEAVDREERELQRAGGGEEAVGQGVVLLEGAARSRIVAGGEADGGGEWEHRAEEVGAAHDVEAGGAHGLLDLGQRVAALVLEEDVVAAPQEAE